MQKLTLLQRTVLLVLSTGASAGVALSLCLMASVRLQATHASALVTWGTYALIWVLILGTEYVGLRPHLKNADSAKGKQR